jgi:hypothetical protein
MVVVAGLVHPTGVFIPCCKPVDATMELFDNVFFNSHTIVFKITHDTTVTHGARRLIDATWKPIPFKSGPFILYAGDTLRIERGQFTMTF